jgi:uncharacterized membrane protein YfcA
VNTSLVKWLMIGSVPAAFSGVLILRAFGNGDAVEARLKVVLGVALLVASMSILVKGFLAARRLSEQRALVRSGAAVLGVEPTPFVVRRLRTLAVGLVGGLLVGMTSVGSGSLIIVCLMLIYPMLSTKQLVGTDLIQAIPLVMSAALGHILFGDFQLSLTASVLVGSIPGVYLGAKVSSRAPDGIIRPALAFVLFASALKLLGMGTEPLGLILLAVVLIAPPIGGIVDAFNYPDRDWALARRSKGTWVRLQAEGAPFGSGWVSSSAYVGGDRPQIVAAGLRSYVSVSGDEVAA